MNERLLKVLHTELLNHVKEQKVSFMVGKFDESHLHENFKFNITPIKSSNLVLSEQEQTDLISFFIKYSEKEVRICTTSTVLLQKVNEPVIKKIST